MTVGSAGRMPRDVRARERLREAQQQEAHQLGTLAPSAVDPRFIQSIYPSSGSAPPAAQARDPARPPASASPRVATLLSLVTCRSVGAGRGRCRHPAMRTFRCGGDYLHIAPP